MAAIGKMGKLDRKAKNQGVLGVTGNAYVQAQENHKNRAKPVEPMGRESFLTDSERRAI